MSVFNFERIVHRVPNLSRPGRRAVWFLGVWLSWRFRTIITKWATTADQSETVLSLCLNFWLLWNSKQSSLRLLRLERVGSFRKCLDYSIALSHTGDSSLENLGRGSAANVGLYLQWSAYARRSPAKAEAKFW